MPTRSPFWLKSSIGPTHTSRVSESVGNRPVGDVAVVLMAVPASAHNASGPRPTNYLTTLGSISPRIPGVTVRVVELGNKLELTNRTDTDVVVLGYNRDPYLRVGPRGLYENL